MNPDCVIGNNTTITKAVIIVAGSGTRMFPLTKNRSKVMLPLANRPLLWHILTSVAKAGVRNFVLVVQNGAADIRQYFGDGSDFGVSIQYAVQKEQLGTAHAIYCARDFVNGAFIVLNGDVLFNTSDIVPLLSLPNTPTSGNAVVCAFETNDVSQFGILELGQAHDNASGNMPDIVNLVEKPAYHDSNLANAGIYLFPESVFDEIKVTGKSQRGEYEITDTIITMIKKGRVQCHKLNFWMDVGRPWDLLAANDHLLKTVQYEIKGDVEEGAVLKGDVVVGSGTVIRSGAYIIGPVVIGNNCIIGPNCFIRPSTTLGNHVHIGNGVEVKNSIVMDNTNIGHLSYVGDSVIGTGCNFGAGTKVANLRHDGKTIRMMVKGKLVDTGRRKLGVIMADGVHTAINTSINTGVVLERDTMLGEVVLH